MPRMKILQKPAKAAPKSVPKEHIESGPVNIVLSPKKRKTPARQPSPREISDAVRATRAEQRALKKSADKDAVTKLAAEEFNDTGPSPPPDPRNP